MKDTDEIEVTMNVFKHHEFDQTYSMYNFLVDSVLIEDYSEYEDLLAEHKDAPFLTLHSQALFDYNTILLIPVVSHKMPEFIIKEFSVSDGKLEVQIEQINSLFRSLEYNDYYSNQYFLEIIVSSTDIDEYQYQITENNNYFTSLSITTNDNLGMLNNYSIIADLHVFEALIRNVKLTNDVESNFDSLFTEDLFKEHIVIVYQHIGCGNACEDNNYVTPLDVGITKSNFSDEILLTLHLYESTNNTPSDETTSTIILLIIENNDLNPNNIVPVFKTTN
jgi:hypothetical protein